MRTDFVAHVTVLLCCAENHAQKRQPPWQPHLTALVPQADQGFSLRSLLEERIAWIEKVGAHNNICVCKTFSYGDVLGGSLCQAKKSEILDMQHLVSNVRCSGSARRHPKKHAATF